jgi:DNA topoisomerase I
LATATTTKPAPRTVNDNRRSASSRPLAAPPERAHRATGAHPRNLVIVESPAKARTVGNILGSDYSVIASVGHVRDLPNYGYGVEDFENFKPKYVVVKDKKRGIDKSSVISDIAEAAKRATNVYLSTDPDREGEAIAWHIREAAGIPEAKTKRVVFHEITKPAIEAAFAAALSQPAAAAGTRKGPGTLDMDLVDAQQARRVLDRLIGFPLTWFVQKKVSRGASAGRVQSVALHLIVKREREIQGFAPVEYWTIHARLAKGDRIFEAELASFPAAARGTTLKPPFRDAGPAIRSDVAALDLVDVLQRCAYGVSSVKKGSRTRAAAPPFTTSTFQQAAVNRLNMSAARAMSIAQELYEGVGGESGLITYMRTDSLNISTEAQSEARRYVERRFGKDYVPARAKVYTTRSKGAQEAHEAIRPTSAARAPETLRGVLNADQMRVYTLVWQRFVASQMADARFDTVAVEIEAKEGSVLRGTFRASAQHLVFPGHLAVYGHDVNDGSETDDDAEAALPELVEGEALRREGVEPRQHFTEPPPRYTEASLVRALEEDGIGRPSTYATIVQTVQKRDYVAKQGRQLVPQELGFLVNDLLEEHMPEYVAVPFTGEMEEELDQVADGERPYVTVLRDFWPEFKRKLDKAEDDATKLQDETDILCNVCGLANMVVKWGRNGKFFACPRYPECSNSLPMGEDGKPVFVAPPKESSYRCPKCGSSTVQKSGPYGAYLDCVQRETGKCDFRSGVPVGIACPEEPNTGQLVEKQARMKGRGVFYACWNYPQCSYTTNTLEPGKMTPARDAQARLAANEKLLERSLRGKAAFAKRRENARTRKAS